MARCPNCGVEVDSADSFCRACGAPLAEAGGPMRSATVEQLIHEYREQIAQHPDDDSARYALGLAYLYHGSLALAREQFEQVIRLAPDFADAYAKLAITCSRLDQVEQAREAVAQAQSIAPANQEYRDIADKLNQLG